MPGWGAVLHAPLYPTPVRACPELSHAHAELWLKNDGLSHAIYGGNKVRMAERLGAEAVRRGAKRVLSFGAVGSHHLLTLTLFARAAGLRSVAFVFPQPRTEHALCTVRAGLGLGLELHPAQHVALIPTLLPRVLRRGDYLIAPGGSNLIGTHACADAVDELAQQIAAGELPSPDLIVVPLGSGGTCGGIAAGIVRQGL
ncbi:MAG TPA: pyridoxal-phosphate dependent enzyme, partial [Polyangiaceae bacterium]